MGQAGPCGFFVVPSFSAALPKSFPFSSFLMGYFATSQRYTVSFDDAFGPSVRSSFHTAVITLSSFPPPHFICALSFPPLPSARERRRPSKS